MAENKVTPEEAKKIGEEVQNHFKELSKKNLSPEEIKRAKTNLKNTVNSSPSELVSDQNIEGVGNVIYLNLPSIDDLQYFFEDNPSFVRVGDMDNIDKAPMKDLIDFFKKVILRLGVDSTGKKLPDDILKKVPAGFVFDWLPIVIAHSIKTKKN